MNFWTETDYLAYGHFEGAHQIKPIALANVDAFDPATESLVYCYTGQTSSMATAWLNVLGLNAKSILFGVNRLNYDGLSADSKPTYHGAENYGYKTGAGISIVNHYNILTAYMEANNLDLPDILASWIKTAADVNTNLTDYYVFDIKSATDFANGHIDGAINVALADVITTATSYTDKPIVVACYTGQTSSMITAWLNILGYDVLSGKFGANGVIYDGMSGHKWAVPTTDLTLVN